MAQLEMFRGTWLIEAQSARALMTMWAEARRTAITPQALHSSHTVAYQQATVAPANVWEAEAFAGFTQPVAVIPITGAIMKNNYCGKLGTAALSTFVQQAQQAENVQHIVLLIDSPGGSVDGTAAFADVIASSTKPTTAIVNGLCCSAAYWLASQCKQIILTSSTDTVGSIGTMASWYNYDKQMEKEGVVLYTYYATESTDKNRASTEANQGDGKLLIQTVLNPLNSVFLNAVKYGRGKKIGANVLAGSVFIGADAIAQGLADKQMPLTQALKSLQIKTEQMNPFAKVAAATKTDGFDVVEGGFLATEQQLTALEQALTDHETAAATAAQQLTEATQREQRANETIAQRDAEIVELKNQITELKKAPVVPPTTPTGVTDPLPPTNLEKYRTSVDAELESLTQ